MPQLVNMFVHQNANAATDQQDTQVKQHADVMVQAYPWSCSGLAQLIKRILADQSTVKQAIKKRFGHTNRLVRFKIRINTFHAHWK
jgi:hypothetical protein